MWESVNPLEISGQAAMLWRDRETGRWAATRMRGDMAVEPWTGLNSPTTQVAAIEQLRESIAFEALHGVRKEGA